MLKCYKYYLVTMCSALVLAACSEQTPLSQQTEKAEAQTTQVDSTPTYIVGTEAYYPPFEYKDENGDIIGFDIDLLKAVGERAGFNVTFLDTPWNTFASSLDNNSRDIWVSAITITDDRKQKVSFSNSYLETYTITMVKDDPKNKSIQKFADLKGKAVATQKETVAYEAIVNMQQGEGILIGTNTQFLSLQKLLLDQVDAAVGKVDVMRFYAKNYPDFKLRELPIDSGASKIEFGFAVKKNNQSLVDKINHGLASVQEDGTLDKLKEKWFGRY